jgi:hypothetical protein
MGITICLPRYPTLTHLEFTFRPTLNLPSDRSSNLLQTLASLRPSGIVFGFVLFDLKLFCVLFKSQSAISLFTSHFDIRSKFS